MNEAIKLAGYTGKVDISMDSAASEFYKNKKYDLDFKNPKSPESDWISSDQLGGIYQEMISKFPIVSIEDPFDQDDWDAWAKLTAATKIQVSLVGFQRAV